MIHPLAAWAAWALMITAAQSGPPPQAVQPARYRADLQALAAETRHPGSPGWHHAQAMVAKRLGELGYVVERHAYGLNKAQAGGAGINIIGTLPGRSRADEIIVVSAHYDSVPFVDGADDNASGVAGVLAVAEALAHTQPERTLMIAVWDQEESGLLGSNAWAAHARKRGLNILHAYVYEMIGYKDARPNTQAMPKGLDWLYPSAKDFLEERKYAGDSIVLVGTDKELMDDFVVAGAEHTLPVLPLHVWWRLRIFCPPDLRRSDHESFWRNGYQATMITDSANFRNPHYHRPSDTVDTIDVDFACSVVETTIDTVRRRLNL